MSRAASIDETEIDQFSRHADAWWDTAGPMRPLHKLNPARLDYIRGQACGHFGVASLKGLSVLDIGCGAGLLCEPLTRQGAKVTGVDASDAAIDVARAHAAGGGLKIDYVCGSAEELAARKSRYDIVTALEIVEHVADLDALMQAIATLVRPGGLVILSTVNRTAKSFLLGIVAAEYLLRWVPRGTHSWRRFVKPSELAGRLRGAGLAVGDVTGMIYDPLNDQFVLKQGDAAVNYLMSAVRGK